MPKLKYPRFNLKWESKNGLNSIWYSNLKSFLLAVQKLKKDKSLKKCSWIIEYAPKTLALFSYDGGKIYDYFRNSSISYTNASDAYLDLLIFTDKKELASCKL